jgi:hypothetical protein
MNEILDLLPIPAERDLPPGQLEMRRDALVAAIATTNAGRVPLARRALRAARGHIAGAWLSLLAMLALGLALVFSGVSGQQRTAQSDAVAVLAITSAAQIAIAAAPAIGSMPVRVTQLSRH